MSAELIWGPDLQTVFSCHSQRQCWHTAAGVRFIIGVGFAVKWSMLSKISLGAFIVQEYTQWVIPWGRAKWQRATRLQRDILYWWNGLKYGRWHLILTDVRWYILGIILEYISLEAHVYTMNGRVLRRVEEGWDLRMKAHRSLRTWAIVRSYTFGGWL